MRRWSDDATERQIYGEHPTQREIMDAKAWANLLPDGGTMVVAPPIIEALGGIIRRPSWKGITLDYSGDLSK